MASYNDRRGDNTSYALSLFEKRTLENTRSFTKGCENKIAEDKKNFGGKSYFELWWDAKGILNCSDVGGVTAHMERYKTFYKEIDTLSARVERGDPKSYDKLLDIYKDLEEMEKDARRDVENNQSTAVCQMLREFLDKKYSLDHNLKQVECIVLKQKMSDVEQTCKSSKDAVYQMSEKMSKLIDENRGIREFMEAMRREKEELKLEAEKRSEAIRCESDRKLKQMLKEAAERDERSEACIRKMKEENDKLRLESEAIRVESEEKLKQAVDEANRRSEARMQEMTDQNLASLQQMTKMLEAMQMP